MKCEKDFMFRAKLKDSTGFVYWNCFGEICSISGKRSRLPVSKAAGHVSYYYHIDEAMHCIDRSTLERYTTFQDKAYRRIFEGDIVKLNDSEEGKVVWVNGSWMLRTGEDCHELLTDWVDNRHGMYNVCNVSCV